MSMYAYGEDCSTGRAAHSAAEEAQREVNYLRSYPDDRIRNARADAEREVAGLHARVGDIEDQIRELQNTIGA